MQHSRYTFGFMHNPKTYLIYFFLLAVLVSGCNSKIEEKIVSPEIPLSTKTDNTAWGNINFGVSAETIQQDTGQVFIKNQMTEPSFKQVITELEGHVSIGSHSFKAYYLISPENTLYRLILIKRGKPDFANYPHDGYHDSYDTLYQILKKNYGLGKLIESKLGHYKLTWRLKNKVIEFEKFYFSGDGNIECKITELDIFHKYDIWWSRRQATTYLKARIKSFQQPF